MKDACREYRSRLVEVAEGIADTNVLGHVEECAKCSALVSQYIQLMTAAKGAWESAPNDLIRQAKALVPEMRTYLVGRRLDLGFFAGARGPVDEFQLLVGAEDLSIRLMASPIPNGWTVMGRVPSEEWVIEAMAPVTVEGTSFEFDVQELKGSAFDLVGPNSILHVPALSELLGNDND